MFTTVGGGSGNGASNLGCTVSGGTNNSLERIRLPPLGYLFNGWRGTNNIAFGPNCTVSGGSNNFTGSYLGNGIAGNSTIGGGLNNIYTKRGTTVGGGENNNCNGVDCIIGGGSANVTNGSYHSPSYITISGGYNNVAGQFDLGGGTSTIGGGNTMLLLAHIALSVGVRITFHERGMGSTITGGGSGSNQIQIQHLEISPRLSVDLET